LFGKLKIYIVYLVCALFLVLNLYYIAKNEYWVLAIPAVVLVILMYFFALDKLMFIIVFFVPLSVTLEELELGVGIALPTEPMMFGVMILFFIKLFFKNTVSKEVIKHPVTIAIIISLVWMFITSLTSELPLVSIKYLISRLWFVVSFYFVAILLFKKYSNINIFIWLYTIPLVGVIIYTTILHAMRGFDEQSAHWIMSPFFNDHTAYGAILSLFIPVIIGYLFEPDNNKVMRMIAIPVLGILILGLILSYSRAAWLSLTISFIAFLILRFKINYKVVFLSIFFLILAFLTFQDQIWMKLEKNKQASSKNFAEHIQSISNISTDASNTERINRWSSAIRMFKKRPFFGWGPGTYQFVYAPFQSSKEKTIISTNTGDKGNAHSEYIGPLSEQGVFGLLCYLGIIITVIYTAIRVYKRAQQRIVRYASITFLTGLFTYFVHGFLNNFLDTDKASVPFWGFVAIIVVLDILYKNQPEKVKVSEEKIPTEDKHAES
jgi:putative inorganic carbon (HCO3(-)) transporter